MPVINHPRINNKPPKGVTNQMALEGIRLRAITKIDPEKKSIPSKNKREILLFTLSPSNELLSIKSMANTWYII
jgi:hypothetical protein